MPSAGRPRVLADLPVSDAVTAAVAGRADLVPWSSPGPVDAIYTYGHPTVDAALLDRHPGVRVVSNFGVGVDHVDLRAAAARGIPVGNTPGILDGATADLAFALLLAAGRRVVEGDRYARGPHFLRFDPSFMLGREVHGSTLGILGMGRIGRQVGLRARGFGMKVLYHNRTRSDEAEVAVGARYVGRDELLAASDYVVLTVPLTDQTRGLIGRAELALMKPTAVLVNVARGAVVDANALSEALAAGRLHAAALDVTDPEPLPPGHELYRLPNCVVAPHVASATVGTRDAMARRCADNLLAGVRGEPLPHEVRPAGSGG